MRRTLLRRLNLGQRFAHIVRPIKRLTRHEYAPATRTSQHEPYNTRVNTSWRRLVGWSARDATSNDANSITTLRTVLRHRRMAVLIALRSEGRSLRSAPSSACLPPRLPTGRIRRGPRIAIRAGSARANVTNWTRLLRPSSDGWVVISAIVAVGQVERNDGHSRRASNPDRTDHQIPEGVSSRRRSDRSRGAANSEISRQRRCFAATRTWPIRPFKTQPFSRYTRRNTSRRVSDVERWRRVTNSSDGQATEDATGFVRNADCGPVDGSRTRHLLTSAEVRSIVAHVCRRTSATTHRGTQAPRPIASAPHAPSGRSAHQHPT